VKTPLIRQHHRYLLVDAHVHFHSCLNQDVFLEAASDNFRVASQQLALPEEPAYCLVLTETSKDHYFRQLQAATKTSTESGWTVHTTAEDCSLNLCNKGRKIIVIAGRQIITREKLEVLALGYAGEFPDGLVLSETVTGVLKGGSIAVIPWGFGKWWFRRGRILKQFLGSRDLQSVFLGDNSGRPRLGGWPRFFILAESKGMLILPGSDPLPFPSQVNKPGSYGFVLKGELDERRPFVGLKRLLQQKTSQPRTFGRPESLRNFFVSQSRIQIHKFMRRLWA
jgi:hypothetical protein